VHPALDDFAETFERVDGAGFDDIQARTWRPISFGSQIPQIRWRPELRSQTIHTPIVGIRIKDVMRHGRIRNAAEVISFTRLKSETKIILVLFDEDESLERLADGWADYAREIAAGGYALVLPQSYSLWEPARRPDNLLSLRRSMLAYAGLQAAGANTIPRIGWVEPIDAERFADWVGKNPAVTAVTLDLMSYQAKSFDRLIGLLAYFDKLTGERLHYLVNGVKASSRIFPLYFATAPERVTVTEATLARTPGVGGRSFEARSAQLANAVAEAKRLHALADETKTIETFLAEQELRYTRRALSRRPRTLKVS
jgi:hypothetical protein